MPSRSRFPPVSFVLTVAATLGALGLVLVGGPDLAAGGKAEARLLAMEKTVRKVETAQKDLDLRLVHTEERISDLTRRVDASVASSAQWLDLQAGSNSSWELGSGGSARVQYVRMDAGTPVFLIEHKALRGELPLRPGETVVAVDDLGNLRRTYAVAMHALRRDRTGAPVSAWLSVTMSER